MEISNKHFEVWSMDFISSLPLYGKSNGSHICVAKLTKFVKRILAQIGEGALYAPRVA